MRILLVEDEKRMGEALCELFRLENYEVDHFTNGSEGLVALESRMYDIAVLDVMLPGMNGYDIAKQARRKGIATPILMLTAKAELDDKVTGLADGTDNSLSNGGSFVAVDEYNVDGALFSKQDLTLNGTGSLTVTSPVGHGIVCKDDLVIVGGFMR